MLAGTGISCRHVCLSVCPSVTSHCSTETGKCRIMQGMLHNIQGTLVFWFWRSWHNSNRVTPNGGAKCRRGRLNAGAAAENGQLSTRSIVKLLWSHVYHTERPPYLFSARSPWCSASSLSSTADSCCKCKLNDSPKLCQEVAGIIIFRDGGFVISL